MTAAMKAEDLDTLRFTSSSPAFGEPGYRVHRLATLVAQLEEASAERVKQAVLSGLEYAVEAAEKEDREQAGHRGQYSALSDLVNFMTGYTRNPQLTGRQKGHPVTAGSRRHG
jgi:hypothetical protein